MYYKINGPRIKYLLEAQKLHAYEIARAVGLSGSNFSCVIKGRFKVSDDIIKKIASVLKVKPSVLIIKEGAPK